MSNVRAIVAIRFLKRIKALKDEINTAKTKMSDISKQLQVNIDNQKIVNKHLAERNAAWAKLNEVKPKVGLYVVS